MVSLRARLRVAFPVTDKSRSHAAAAAISMFAFGHRANRPRNPTHKFFSSKKRGENYMAADKKCYILGSVTKASTIKASTLFKHKYHDVFLSALGDHYIEHLGYGYL